MVKNTSIIICTLLLAYFAFTSGLIFETLHSNTVGEIDLPYSIAFSGERLNMVGIFNEDDVACARWLVDNRGDVPLVADYNGSRLLMGCMRDFELDGFAVKPSDEHYLFLSSWNVKHQKMVVGLLPGLRGYSVLPNLEKAVVSFKKGDAVVYYLEN